MAKSRIVKQLNKLNILTYSTKKPQVIVNPEKYQSMKVTFQWQNHNGHMGARKFWQDYLPTLKFYNPNFNIDIIRIANRDKSVDVPCKIELINSNGKIVEELDMKDKRSESIMDELLSKIDHQAVPSDQIVKFDQSKTL